MPDPPPAVTADAPADVDIRDSFAIAYDGNALRAHEMDVRNLAPALMGMADLIQAVNDLVNPEGTTVRVKLRATDSGSLVVHLVLDVGILEAVKTFFSSDSASALLNIREVLGLLKDGAVTLGVIEILRRLLGREPKVVGKRLDLGKYLYEIQIPGSDTLIEVPESVYRALRDSRVREAAAKVMGPLEEEGVDQFKMWASDDLQQQPVTVVTEDDVPAFTPQPVDVVDLDEHSEVALVQLVTPQFERRYKWRFDKGDGPFYAEMKDDRFWEQVEDRSLLFGAGDLMRVRFLTRQTMVGGKLTAQREVVEVIHAFPKDADQGKLFGPGS